MKDKKDKRKHSVNDNFFKKWSHNMAYILGFWWTDGWIERDKRFGICQNTKDVYLLKLISSYMDSKLSY